MYQSEQVIGCSAVLSPLEPAMIPLLFLLVIPARMFVSKEDLPGRPDTTGTAPSDSDSDPITPQTWYVDEDGDGFGATNVVSMGCTAPDGASDINSDCDMARSRGRRGDGRD